MDTKSQRRNERFELDICWCELHVNMSDDGPKAYVYYMIEREEGVPTQTTCDEMAQRLTDANRGQQGEKGE